LVNSSILWTTNFLPNTHEFCIMLREISEKKRGGEEKEEDEKEDKIVMEEEVVEVVG